MSLLSHAHTHTSTHTSTQAHTNSQHTQRHAHRLNMHTHLFISCTAGSIGVARRWAKGPNTLRPRVLSLTGCSGLSRTLEMRPDASSVKKAIPRLMVVPWLGSTRRLWVQTRQDVPGRFDGSGVKITLSMCTDVSLTISVTKRRWENDLGGTCASSLDPNKWEQHLHHCKCNNSTTTWPRAIWVQAAPSYTDVRNADA